MASKKTGSKLTPSVQKKIIDTIKIGATKTDAAAVAGVSRRVIYNWIKKGEEQSAGIYREFVDAMEMARGQGAAYLLGVIHDDIKSGGVDSAKWLLERTRPDDYGRNRVDVHTESKLTVNVIYDDD